MQDISKPNKPTIKKRPRYFLIFLVVSSIVSFLSMFNMCASKDYTDRTYVAEGMALSAGAKAASADFYEQEKRFPMNNQEAGLVKPNQITGQSVKAIEILPQGKIKIIYNDKLADNALLFLKAAFNDHGEIIWQCHEVHRLEVKMLPSNCREQVGLYRESSGSTIAY